MRLTKIKGIAHDLAHHLDLRIWFGHYKDLKKDIKTNVLEKKDSFDKECIGFFKERLPESFEFSRIKEIFIEIHHSTKTLRIKIRVKVNNKDFSYSSMSMMA